MGGRQSSSLSVSLDISIAVGPFWLSTKEPYNYNNLLTCFLEVKIVYFIQKYGSNK